MDKELPAFPRGKFPEEHTGRPLNVPNFTQAEIVEILEKAGWGPQGRADTRMSPIFSDKSFSDPPSSGNILYDATTTREEKFPQLHPLEKFDDDLFDINPEDFKNEKV